MASVATIVRTLRVFSDTKLSPQAMSEHVARVARTARDDLIQGGRASPSYGTTVNGTPDAREETVRPGGAIIYRFNVLGQATSLALERCRKASPIDSGVYQRAWIVVVDGKRWSGEFTDIPTTAEVMIVNPMPYGRKIDMGAMRLTTGQSGIVEAARQFVRRRFPSLTISRTFVTLPPGLGIAGVEVPYILRGQARSTAQKYSAQLERLGVRSIVVNRRDSWKGQAMTYPALTISAGA